MRQIKDDQWEIVLPESFRTRRMDHAPTLREIVNYHAYDDAWVPDMLAGQTMAQAGHEKFKGDLLGSDPHGAFAAIVEQACAAAEVFEDLDQTVHCSFGDYPARHYNAEEWRAIGIFGAAIAVAQDAPLQDRLLGLTGREP